MRFFPSLLALLSLCASFFLPRQSYADSFTASYLAAGVQSPGSITSNVNTFESATYNTTTGTTTFGNSGITGTYSGSYNLLAANLYGGAGGTGNFISTNSTYTLTLSSNANYFGLWFSALDAGNQLSFYNGSTLLYTFTAASYQAAVGACTGSNAYCGNPNANFKGLDSSEQFAFISFSDTNGTFNKIVFTESPNTGNFESDNHSVALLNSTGSSLGTNIVTPEPSSWILSLTGIGAIATAMGFRRSAIL